MSWHIDGGKICLFILADIQFLTIHKNVLECIQWNSISSAVYRFCNFVSIIINIVDKKRLIDKPYIKFYKKGQLSISRKGNQRESIYSFKIL